MKIKGETILNSVKLKNETELKFISIKRFSKLLRKQVILYKFAMNYEPINI